MRVDIQRIQRLKAELVAVNNLDLNEIDFMSDGRLVKVSQSTLDWFEQTGLSNVDFITSGYYLLEDGPTDEAKLGQQESAK